MNYEKFKRSDQHAHSRTVVRVSRRIKNLALCGLKNVLQKLHINCF